MRLEVARLQALVEKSDGTALQKPTKDWLGGARAVPHPLVLTNYEVLLEPCWWPCVFEQERLKAENLRVTLGEQPLILRGFRSQLDDWCGGAVSPALSVRLFHVISESIFTISCI